MCPTHKHPLLIAMLFVILQNLKVLFMKIKDDAGTYWQILKIVSWKSPSSLLELQVWGIKLKRMEWQIENFCKHIDSYCFNFVNPRFILGLVDFAVSLALSSRVIFFFFFFFSLMISNQVSFIFSWVLLKFAWLLFLLIFWPLNFHYLNRWTNLV